MNTSTNFKPKKHRRNNSTGSLIIKSKRKRRNKSLVVIRNRGEGGQDLKLDQDIEVMNKKLKCLISGGLRKKDSPTSNRASMVKSLPFFMRKAREFKNRANFDLENIPLIRFYNNISNGCLSIGESKKALEIVDWVLKSFHVRDFETLALVFFTKGSIMVELEEYSEAVFCFRESFEKLKVEFSLLRERKRGLKRKGKPVKQINSWIIRVVLLTVKSKISELSVLSLDQFINKNNRYLQFEIKKLRTRFLVKHRKYIPEVLISKVKAINQKAITETNGRIEVKSTQTANESNLFNINYANKNPNTQNSTFFSTNVSQNCFDSPEIDMPHETSIAVNNNKNSLNLFRKTLGKIFTPTNKKRVKVDPVRVCSIQGSMASSHRFKDTQSANRTVFNEKKIGGSFNPANWYMSPIPMPRHLGNRGAMKSGASCFFNSLPKRQRKLMNADLKYTSKPRHGEISRFKSVRASSKTSIASGVVKRVKSGFFHATGSLQKIDDDKNFNK